MEAARALSLADRPTSRPAADGLLALRGITKHWRTMERPVLDDATLSLASGESIHIHGRNGVGKTTLLRIASGLITPDQGEVELDGLDPERDRREYQARIAFLPAGDRGLYARLSVRAHLDLWARVTFIPRRRRAELIDALLERFELTQLAKHRVDRLSMGQRQRVRLAGLTMHDPSLVLLDEPFNSLDTEAVQLAGATFRSVLRRGGAVVCCSPEGDRAGFDFDRSFVLQDGRLESA